MINWIGDDDDAIATVGDYVLRAEQMDEEKFWWRTYFKDETIAECWDSGYMTRSMEQARIMAEYHMYKHQGKI